jgi:hypothetical protein
MTRSSSVAAGAVLLVGIFGLAFAGQWFAPPAQAPSGGDVKGQQCDVDAPPPLHAAAKRWCANDLFLKAIVTTSDAENVIAVMQFTPNGAQTWQLQSGLLSGEFRNLTDQLFASAGGRNVSVALNDAGDRRVGACGRKADEAAATCAEIK